MQIESTIPHQKKAAERLLFSAKSTLRVGEILLRNVKFSLRSSEIAAAVGGFHFTFRVSGKFRHD